MTPPPKSATLLDSYAIAYAFLFGEEEKLPPMLPRQTLGLIEPDTPKGYQRWANITASNPHLHATTTIPLAYTAQADILLCEAPRAPTLLTPNTLRHLWLHLHIATLIIATTLIAPQTLRAAKLRPCIIGLHPLPPPCFPSAFAALQDHAKNASILDDLPF